MTRQTQIRYTVCDNFQMNVAGRIVKNLLNMDLERPYNPEYTPSERSTYAGNICSAIREFRNAVGDDKSQHLLSGILGVDVGDLEIKTLAISRGISEDAARESLWE
ncbi:hypothetical protein J4217_01530 [Candidatus Pacearchaeota archaeon]|nr:hypothetical protein [Candidatus Pacearchaeota archaeon]